MAGLANLLIVVGLFALTALIGGKLGEASFRTYEAFCRFVDRPSYIIIPSILAWAAGMLLLISTELRR